ncbi:hypothetical protein A3K73_00200 [Candidatus Pacearchaeota archaeon RBG_13_36_9]|nr:MAG: hypothetical protein A3K73_00200 [Candidatus Pacearchaeota archaeon RBG_13_36_9]
MTDLSEIKILRDRSYFHEGPPKLTEVMVGDCIEVKDPKGNTEEGLVSKVQLCPADFKKGENSVAFIQTLNEVGDKIFVRAYIGILEHFINGKLYLNESGSCEKGTPDYKQKIKDLGKTKKLHAQISNYKPKR